MARSHINSQVVPVLRADAENLPVEAISARSSDHFVGIKRTDWWVIEALSPRWTAAYRMVQQDGYAVVGELRIYPTEDSPETPLGEWSARLLGVEATAPAGGLTASVVRAATPHAHARAGRRAMAALRRDQRKIAQAIFRRLAQRGVGRFIERRSSDQARKWTDEVIIRVAAAYSRAIDAGSRRPILDAARESRISAKDASNAISKARGKKFLRSTSRGVATGGLTASGGAVLARLKVQPVRG